MPEMPRVCLFCEQSVVLFNTGNDSDKVLCKKKGVVSGDYVCRKFVYDPLKRVPTPSPKFDKFSGSDLLL